MKIGDKVDVLIGSHVVTQAQVKSIDTAGSTATLVVPATLVVMGIRTDLTDLPGNGEGATVIIEGVDRPEGSATITETQNIDTNTTTVSNGNVEASAVEAPSIAASTIEASAPAQEVVPVQPAAPPAAPPAPVETAPEATNNSAAVDASQTNSEGS